MGHCDQTIVSNFKKILYLTLYYLTISIYLLQESEFEAFFLRNSGNSGENEVTFQSFIKNSSDYKKYLEVNNFTSEYDFGDSNSKFDHNYDEYDDNNVYDIIQGDIEYELEERKSCYSCDSNSYSF